ncbi:hypothetical protein V6Z05_14875 [Leptospira venezuelensis]|uniref:hypothetical protein n=1 Tax=Leptospira venezuelensis TaxID=1958811 RepID=UPI000A36D982|nr:hypothetical protein [Leptospira venezuelensis]
MNKRKIIILTISLLVTLFFTVVKIDKEDVEIVAECNLKSKEINYRVHKSLFFFRTENDISIDKSKGCPTGAILKFGSIAFTYADNTSVTLPYRYY